MITNRRANAIVNRIYVRRGLGMHGHRKLARLDHDNLDAPAPEDVLDLIRQYDPWNPVLKKIA